MLQAMPIFHSKVKMTATMRERGQGNLQRENYQLVASTKDIWFEGTLSEFVVIETGASDISVVLPSLLF